ncbi:MAG: ASCH domain-containing protein [Lachnospiraceae bacterium]|nr:ASCH domain-containing protein [Lachnospiraceae bacterium]MDY4969128.1 ASCH domain-containing protein [Lachnospiraceae bacterium]
MKAISIKNPYATQILRGTKNIEYRTWDIKHRGDLLICSSANPKVSGMMSGCALCVVELVDTQYDSENDVYEWYMDNVRKVKAFPVTTSKALCVSPV